MAEPEVAPEKIQTRPERRFEGRRRFYSIILVGILLIIAGVVARGFANPMAGSENIGRVPATPTPVAVMIRPTVVRPPAPVEPSATPLRPASNMPSVSTTATGGGALTCWANKDIALDDKTIIPRDAMLRITGWTAARSGMVELQNLWIAETDVRCNGDPRQYERPFVMIPTRPRASAAAGGETKIVYVPVTATPNPNAVAPVVATPTRVIGMWFNPDGCLVINVEYVREIWVNGKGVSNGLYCNVNDVRIVVTK
jgi:hypothetical protein